MKILLVEDHGTMGELIRDHLSRAGFVVDLVTDGEEALGALGNGGYDGMVLDRGLPGRDGMSVLAAMRQSPSRSCPVIMLTAHAEIDDRVEGLNAGADDYLGKPFDMQELEARIRAVLRRPGSREAQILQCENLTLDTTTCEAFVADRPLGLARREFVLLHELVRAHPRIVVKDQLEDRLYSLDEEVTPNAGEAVVSRLRKKLAGGQAGVQIATVRGIGYRLEIHRYEDPPTS